MGKNILLNESQFKKYIKYTLNEDDNNSEGMDLYSAFADDAQNEANKEAEYKKEYARIKKLVDEWPYDENMKLSDADLHVGTDTTPRTFEEWFESTGYCEAYMQIAINNLLNKAWEGIYGMTKSAWKDLKAGKSTKHHRTSDESIEDFKRRQIVGQANREAFDKKIEKDKFDKLYKEKLIDLTINGDERLNACENNDLSNDQQFQILKNFCNEYHIICTENGDIYIPIKISKQKRAKVPEAYQNNKQVLIHCLCDNVEKMNYDKLIHRYGRWLTPPYILPKVISFGPNLSSNVIHTNYVPETVRGEV